MQIEEASKKPGHYDYYRRYFAAFLPSIIGRRMLEDLEEVTCCVEIVVTDLADPPWRLHIEAGILTYVGQEGTEPECRYLLELNALIDVITAVCTPQEAFFEMSIDIEGDIKRGLEVSTVLERFFAKFPLEI